MDNYFKPASLLEEVLCSAIAVKPRIDLKDAYYRLGDDVVWKASKANLIAPIVAKALLEVLGEKRTPQHWVSCYQDTDKRISAYLKELDRVSSLLAYKGIPLVALKNSGIVRGIYRIPGCCPMGDMDVLVDKEHYDDAHSLLIEDGYVFKARNSMEMAFYKRLSDGSSLWLELLWRTVDGRWIRPDQEPKTEEVLARSIEIPGTAVRLLSPEDNLLQVSLHTAKHTYVRAPGFRLHTDVDRIVHRYRIDWDLFLARVKRLNVKTAVYFSLLIPEQLLGTPVPKDVLDQLKPERWKEKMVSAWLKKVGLFNPNEQKFSKMGFMVFHSLLYDNFIGLLRSLFPENWWMKEHYNFENSYFLLFYHCKHLLDLIFRRANT